VKCISITQDIGMFFTHDTDVRLEREGGGGRGLNPGRAMGKEGGGKGELRWSKKGSP